MWLSTEFGKAIPLDRMTPAHGDDYCLAHRHASMPTWSLAAPLARRRLPMPSGSRSHCKGLRSDSSSDRTTGSLSGGNADGRSLARYALAREESMSSMEVS